MAISSSTIAIGLSGMQAYQAAINATANNIANANTVGFQPVQPTFQASTPSGSGVTYTSSTAAQDPLTAAADPDGLADDLIDMMTYSLGFQANARVVKTGGQTLGTMLNVFS